MQERPYAMTEIDIAGDQENTERGGTADTDLQLESEQRAMQALSICGSNGQRNCEAKGAAPRITDL